MAGGKSLVLRRQGSGSVCAIDYADFFRMSKFSSFQRQLNLYDFKRITAGPDKGGYYHEHFVRESKGLCKYILRQQIKGTITRKPASDVEPDFYCISVIGNVPTDMDDMHMGCQDGYDKTNSGASPNVVTDHRSNLKVGNGFLIPKPDVSYFQNAGGHCHRKMSSGDVQGHHANSWIGAMGGEGTGTMQRYYERLTESEFLTPAKFCEERAGFSWGNESVGSLSFRSCNTIKDDNDHVAHVPNQEREPYKRSNNESLVSMLCQSSFSRCKETRRLLNVTPLKTHQVANEQVCNGYFDDNLEPRPLATPYPSKRANDAQAVLEPIGTINSDSLSDWDLFEWMPHHAYF